MLGFRVLFCRRSIKRTKRKVLEQQAKLLTAGKFCDIVDGRMEAIGLFFMRKNRKRPKNKNNTWRWKLCVQKSHWHVQNVSSVITT